MVVVANDDDHDHDISFHSMPIDNHLLQIDCMSMISSGWSMDTA
jgi:hypothetical protein